MENISSDMWENVRSTSTHQIHSVPKPNKVNYWGYVINTDWLNKVNLKTPTTLDEYLAVCKAFTTQDPDGNGKADTYGISFTNNSLGNNSYWTNSAFLQTAFGIGNAIPDVDGQFKIREKFQGYIPFLKYIKQLNDEKVLDPEFVTNKGYADSDKLKEFRIGMIGSADGALQAPFTYNAPLKNDKDVSTYLVGEPIWGTWMISATANVDEALRLIDFGNSEEGFELMYLGTQGTYYNSYDPVSRFIDRTDDQTAALKTVSSSYIPFAFAKDGKSAIVEYAPTQADVDRYHTELNNAIDASSLINVPTIKAPLLSQLNSDIPDLVKKKDEQELKFVMGEITEDQFRDFLTKEYYPATDAAEKEYVQVATAAYANMKK
jgi:putative aldouronate transport system substrate-binding protein